MIEEIVKGFGVVLLSMALASLVIAYTYVVVMLDDKGYKTLSRIMAVSGILIGIILLSWAVGTSM